MSRTDAKLYGERPRPAFTYRGSRPQDAARGAAAYRLKAAQLRRGMTRREMDAEREAVRRFITDGKVNRGFTPGRLMTLVQQMVS